MPLQPVTLAKLSPPKLFGALARERLFAALDAQRRHPAVWIAGPPGAGKTTLVASYLLARRLACSWYQVDAGDADPASFFHYLAQAAQAASAAQTAPRSRITRRSPLRLPVPEYLTDLPDFTRRFFRALFDRLPTSSVLVLDNCQEADAASPFHAIVRDALSEVRDGQGVILISRTDPPAAFARAQANGLIGTIGWDELRLTDIETRAIATAEHELDAATLQTLQQQSGGWAAGLVMLLQRLKLVGAMQTDLPEQALQTVFSYFVGQVFDQVPTATRKLLLCTAFLPRVTEPAARALSGNADAGRLLEDLYRQRLFTERQAGDATSYRYHALFREFLLNRTRTRYTPDEQRQLRTRSAELLETGGDCADALRLHVDSADWNAATALILKQAGALIKEGRWRTLEAWIALLPAEQVAQTPWLTLWLGSALILVDPPQARALLERAFDRFLALGDSLGQALAATGTIESHNIEFSDFRPLDPWIVVLERLLQQGLVFPSATTRLRAHGALMLAAMLRQPAHPMLPGCLREASAMLAQDIPATAKADIATQLLQCFDFTGDLKRATQLVEQTAALFDGDALPPLRRAGWWVFLSYHSALVGRYRDGFDALDKLRAIAQESGLTWFSFFDSWFRALLHLLGPAPLAAAPLLQQLGAIVKPGRPAEAAQYHLARVLLYQVQGEPSLAVYHGELCLEAAKQTGGALFNVLFPSVIASAFVEAGQPDRALALVTQARALGAGTAYRHHEALMLMVQAYAHAARGDVDRAHALLAQAFTRGRDDDTESLFRWLVVGFRRMLGMALQAGIQADGARSLIDRFAIAAESPDVEHWPWPIRIYTLGRFALVIGGAPLRSERKVQKKPQEMLKYLVAQGGREVSAALLNATLWPDAEGGAAVQSFEVTLRRLRKLLGNDEAVQLRDGKLALNAGICWVDAWAFERSQGRAEVLLGCGAASADGANPDALAQRVLKLYPGHFLAGDDEAPWLLGCRQRLASKFLRHVAAVGQRWQDDGDPGQAELAYQRALELDPLAESLSRRLMILQLRQGRRAEALETYRRCRQMLSVVLGMAPSAQTEAVYRSLHEPS